IILFPEIPYDKAAIRKIKKEKKKAQKQLLNKPLNTRKCQGRIRKLSKMALRLAAEEVLKAKNMLQQVPAVSKPPNSTTIVSALSNPSNITPSTLPTSNSAISSTSAPSTSN